MIGFHVSKVWETRNRYSIITDRGDCFVSIIANYLPYHKNILARPYTVQTTAIGATWQRVYDL